jgi:ABC-2 type transport system ATP-binding protein
MQRRIGLAQALINDPDLVILDEPTSGLDPIGCREVKDLILALAQRGKTVILSSHLLADVEDVCDRVVIYYGGRVQAMGTLQELLAAPDQLRITVPLLPRPTLERVLEIIRKDVAADRVRIDTPTQNLESYFLGVVNKAKQTEAETSGATSGNKVAAYLRGEADAPASQSAKVLDRLTAPAPAAPVFVQEPKNVDTVDHSRLAELSKTDQTPLPTDGTPPPAEAEKAELERANVKLSSLVGKPK